MSNGPVAADELRLLIERIERIEEEIKGLQEDRKEVYSEAKSRGFCPKTMKFIVSERKKKPEQRREEEAMRDLYKAALGMLDGTPLGNWAIEKLNKGEEAKKPAANPASPAPAPAAALPPPAGAAQPDTPEEPAPPPLTMEDARRMGAEAARAGTAVTANPFPPRDPRRAAWDEAWCRELGSDGMEIPEALRPAAKKPKGEETAPAAGDDADDGDSADAEDAGEEADSAAGAGEVAGDEVDAVYQSARAAVMQEQYASVSRIQKLFGIGYNRAARIMERLEAEGVVSAPEMTGRREVLFDKEGRPK